MENNSSVDLIGGEEADIGRPRKSRVKGLVWLLSFFKLSKDRTPNLEDCKIECSRMSPDQCHMLLTPDGQERPKKITQRTQPPVEAIYGHVTLTLATTSLKSDHPSRGRKMPFHLRFLHLYERLFYPSPDVTDLDMDRP
ncbi:hypothetical protein AAG570_012855 [Ranatra chinensis]|uniref:Uncharacterized protein n=1 Tax=Ranatra chinensis TaxID=642074 RepID=A0ABD0YF23_9HEMI